MTYRHIPDDEVILIRLVKDYLHDHPDASHEALARIREIGKATLKTIHEREGGR